MLKKQILINVFTSFLLFTLTLNATEEPACNPANEECLPPQVEDDCSTAQKEPEEELACTEEEEEENLLDILNAQK